MGCKRPRVYRINLDQSNIPWFFTTHNTFFFCGCAINGHESYLPTNGGSGSFWITQGWKTAWETQCWMEVSKSFRYQKWRISWSPYSLLFWGDVFSYISRIHPYSDIYIYMVRIPGFHFRYLNSFWGMLTVTVFVGKQYGGAQHLWLHSGNQQETCWRWQPTFGKRSKVWEN